MKKIRFFSRITFFSLFFILLNSCDDNSETFMVSNPTAAVLEELSFTELELDAVNTQNPAITFVWGDADYGIQSPVSYNVEFSGDEAFTNPVIAATTNAKTAITLSVSDVNTAAGNAGLNPFVWKTLYVRVVSSLGSRNGVAVNSNTISLDILPYFNYIYNDFYLVGDATAPGWDNNNNNPALFRDQNNSDVYHYTGRFSEGGQFKVLPTKGQWQPQYGTDDGSTVGVNLGGGSDPESFPNAGASVITEGFYTFSIDFSNNTFTFNSFDASGMVSPATLSLSGSSTVDVLMTPLSFDRHIWYANSVRLTPGEVEFVTDSGSRWGNSVSFAGVASSGGGAIPVVVEDDYDIWFNDLTGRYILIPLNL